MARSYKVRKFENGRNKAGDPFINYSLTLPTALAEKLIKEFGEGLEFEIELTDEGILYKPVEPEVTVPEKLPFKAGKRSNGASAAKAEPKAKPKARPAAKSKPAAKSGNGSAPKRPTAKGKPAAKAAAKARPAAKTAAKGKTKPAAPRAPKARPRAKAAA